MTSPSAVALRVGRGLPTGRLQSLGLSVVSALCVWETMRRGVPFAESVAAAIIIVALVIFCSRRPHIAVIGIVAWLPLQLVVLAYLYKLGAPTMAVRYLGYLKEFFAVALLVAVFTGPERYRSHRRLDALDVVALAYVGLATAYLLLPFLSSGALGGQNFQVRLNAWRAEALYVVVFFLVRQLAFPARWVSRVRTTVFAVAVVQAGFAIWEQVDRAGFKNFMSNTIEYQHYVLTVLKVQNASAGLLGLSEVGSGTALRIGGIFNDSLTLGFFMLIPLGLGLERLLSRRVSTVAALAAAGALTTIVLTLTRSAALGAGLAAILAVGLVNRRSPGRLRLIIALATAAVLLLPAAGHSSLVSRFSELFGAHRSGDSQQHVDSTRNAFNFIVARPLGAGLGSNTGTAGRFHTGIQITAENSYLETGAELGVAAMALLVACVLLLLIQLRARSKIGGTAGQLAAGSWLAGCGLALGACFLQPWLEIPVALVFWTVAGMALSAVPDEAQPPVASSSPIKRA